jgi:hypothetical protein
MNLFGVLSVPQPVLEALAVFDFDEGRPHPLRRHVG